MRSQHGMGGGGTPSRGVAICGADHPPPRANNFKSSLCDRLFSGIYAIAGALSPPIRTHPLSTTSI